DEREIADLLVRWGHARDGDDWETLSGCFHEGATIHVSWFSGAAREFVALSRAMALARKPGSHLKHVTTGSWTRINGRRAFSRSHVTLHVRTAIQGHEADLTAWLRFFDLLERRNGVWGLVRRCAVYDKDRVDAVDPRGFPHGLFAGI